jgi:two-component system, NarL family, sensor histidine kinase DesK
MRSIEGVAPRQARTPAGGARSVFFGAMVWLVWLLYLVQANAAVLDSHPSPLRLIGSLAGEAVFVALYVWTAWHSARKVLGTPPLAESQTAMELWLPILAMLALSIVLTEVNGVALGVLFIYTCASAGGRLPARQAMSLLIVVIALTALYSWRVHLPPSVTIPNVFTIGFAGVCTITMVFAVATGRRWREEREELSRFAAVTEERLRIARDLHDLLGHNLSVIALKSELAGRLVQAAPERAAAEIGDIERVARTALQEVREAVAGYRQPTLVSELHGAREVLAAAGIAYRAEGDDTEVSGLPAPVDAVLAWTVREGITNIVRHSRARHCKVRLARGSGEACVEVTDDGAHEVTSDTARSSAQPAIARPGNGLRGLAERVEALGGRLEAGPIAGGGFRLVVAVPVEQSKQQSAGSPRTAVDSVSVQERGPHGPVVAPAATPTSAPATPAAAPSSAPAPTTPALAQEAEPSERGAAS